MLEAKESARHDGKQETQCQLLHRHGGNGLVLMESLTKKKYTYVHYISLSFPIHSKFVF